MNKLGPSENTDEIEVNPFNTDEIDERTVPVSIAVFA